MIAHELSHVKHRDILISTVAATLAGALMLVARSAQFAMLFGGYGGEGDRRRDEGGMNPLATLAMIIIAPIVALIIQMAISRLREYAADESGGRLSGRPLSLANALLKLERRNDLQPSPQANPVTAHLYIVNSLRGGGMASLFSSHASATDRVARLEALAGELGKERRGSISGGRELA